MAKATALKLVRDLPQSQPAQPGKEEVLSSVRQNIEHAVSQLRTLGRGYEKAAWMLEDSLNYAFAESDRTAGFTVELTDEIYSAQGVDWASLIQAEELFEASR